MSEDHTNINRKPTTLQLSLDHEQIRQLMQADPVLGRLIQLIGPLDIPLRADPFMSLVSSIISQQLSVKAAATIWGRVVELCGDRMNADRISELSDEQLREVGVSMFKIRYIRDLCHHVQEGMLPLEQLDELSDQEVMKALIAVKGIGRWTAEMFLIFSLGRTGILSHGDAGLQRAARWLHGMDERSDGGYTQQHEINWTAHPTAASIYLWEAINIGWVDSGKSFADYDVPDDSTS
ncbi:DNA-3-methyladenine glycosylase family protein [Paenibacillus sp. WLX2291]|uniref:DNA-3-methyladenine glycosylase family protein n=1 Tax=Paenibacillus sp. WLX2291 TaxID=3296934 RepID=UPI003983FBD5